MKDKVLTLVHVIHLEQYYDLRSNSSAHDPEVGHPSRVSTRGKHHSVIWPRFFRYDKAGRYGVMLGLGACCSMTAERCPVP